MSFRLPYICNLKSISILSGCLSMPDAISLHHCLQNHHQYCIILSSIRALNINRPIVNLAEVGLLYSKCTTFKAAWVCGQVLATTLLSVQCIKYSFCWTLTAERILFKLLVFEAVM